MMGDQTITSWAEKNGAGVNILIDQERIDIKRIVNYVRKADYNFLFSLSDNMINSSGISLLLPHLYTLFSLSGSFLNNNKSIPVFYDNSNTVLAEQEKIRDYFLKQGEPGVSFVGFNNGKTEVESNILVADLSVLQSITAHDIVKYRSSEIIRIIIPFRGSCLLKDEMKGCTLLSSDNKYTIEVLRIVTSQMNVNFLEEETALWKRRAMLYLSFLSLVRKVDKSQYYELQAYYDKEYEVLPVWYKRFGHILKVISGKRTFKSLFRDDVKKYKE